MSSCGSKASTETSVPLVNGIINNDLFHSSHTSTGHDIKSFTCCTFVWQTFAELCLRLCSQLDWCRGCLVATNLEVQRGDNNLLHYCTWRVEAANDAHTDWINTAKRIYQNWYSNVATYI